MDRLQSCDLCYPQIGKSTSIAKAMHDSTLVTALRPETERRVRLALRRARTLLITAHAASPRDSVCAYPSRSPLRSDNKLRRICRTGCKRRSAGCSRQIDALSRQIGNSDQRSPSSAGCHRHSVSCCPCRHLRRTPLYFQDGFVRRLL